MCACYAYDAATQSPESFVLTKITDQESMDEVAACSLITFCRKIHTFQNYLHYLSFDSTTYPPAFVLLASHSFLSPSPWVYSIQPRVRWSSHGGCRQQPSKVIPVTLTQEKTVLRNWSLLASSAVALAILFLFSESRECWPWPRIRNHGSETPQNIRDKDGRENLERRDTILYVSHERGKLETRNQSEGVWTDDPPFLFVCECVCVREREWVSVHVM